MADSESPSQKAARSLRLAHRRAWLRYYHSPRGKKRRLSLKVLHHGFRPLACLVYPFLKVFFFLHGQREFLQREFTASLLIASLITVLHNFSFFEDSQLDFLMLAAPVERLLQTWHEPPDPAPPAITILMIDDELYENRFNQRSPLDREQLLPLIGNVMQARPAVLVIDLDLSPYPSTNTGEELDVQAYVNELTDILVPGPDLSDQDNPAPGQPDENRQPVSVILITPVPVSDLQLADMKGEWMEHMCDAGLEFGLPDIASHDGNVIMYEKQALLLSNTIMQSVHLVGEDDDNHYYELGPRHDTSHDGEVPPLTICSDIDATKAPLRYVHKRRDNRIALKMQDETGHRADTKVMQWLMHENELSLMNFSFIKEVSHMDYLEACPGDQCSPQLENGIVFLGGAYGTTDYYSTPLGELSGVQLHAGALYSEMVELRHPPKVVEFVLDVFLGVLYGSLVFMLAEKYRSSRSLGSIALNVIAQPLLFLFLAFVGGTLMLWNIWLNPGPMLVGMAIHEALERIEEPHTELAEGRDGPARLLGIRESTIKWGIYLMILTLALSIVIVQTFFKTH